MRVERKRDHGVEDSSSLVGGGSVPGVHLVAWEKFVFEPRTRVPVVNGKLFLIEPSCESDTESARNHLHQNSISRSTTRAAGVSSYTALSEGPFVFFSEGDEEQMPSSTCS